MAKFLNESVDIGFSFESVACTNHFTSYPRGHCIPTTTFCLNRAEMSVFRRFHTCSVLAKSQLKHKKLLEELVPKSAIASTYLIKKVRKELEEREFEKVAKNKKTTESDEKKEFDKLCLAAKAQLKNDFLIVEEIQAEEGPSEEEKLENKVEFPLGKEQKVSVRSSTGKDDVSRVWGKQNTAVDRGYHVVTTGFMDDYVRGAASDVPDDLLAQSLTLGQRRMKKVQFRQLKPESSRRFGPPNAVETIDFQLPMQQNQSKRTKASKDEDWRVRYGTPDPTVPISQKNKCAGCGGQLHCQECSVPGFLPSELFLENEARPDVSVLCRRCYLLKHHNFLLNVTVSSVDYREMMSMLRHIDEALIVLLVDMLDCPGSILGNLAQLVGERKPMIVVGNKVDLLPPEPEPGYVRRFIKCLHLAMKEFQIWDNFNVLHTQLISAKSGFGIERLITAIQKKWGARGHVFLVGCTNTGKSTLFNRLLQSDLCKVQAVDLVERATTSIWPGTTISLLKFPVMNPVPWRLERRDNRLREEQERTDEDESHRQTLFQCTGDAKFAALQGYVGRTFEVQKKEEEPKLPSTVSSMFFVPDQPPAEKKKSWNPDNQQFKSGNWCYDTPGTVSSQQIINKLTLEELVTTLPKTVLNPRTFTVQVEDALLLGGLGRLIYTSGPPGSILLTVFASKELPLHVIPAKDIGRFMKKFWGTNVLGAPVGGTSRLRLFPKFKYVDLNVETHGSWSSAVDVILSSAGWVGVTGPRDTSLSFRVYTPGGVGIYVRTPALLPFAVKMRGKRLVGTKKYEMRALKEALNLSDLS